MSMTWGEYIEQTVESINDVNARNMLLHLSKHPDRDWTHRELKKEVCPDMEEKKILGKLKMLADSDLIRQGVADIQFRGLRDGTLCLILRNRFEMEIGTFEPPDLRPDLSRELELLKKDRERLRGMLSNLVGKFAEFQLMTEFRSRQHFSLSAFFEGVRDKTRLDIRDARLRVKIQRPDGKEMEIDVLAESACGRCVLAEVKKTGDKTGVGAVRKFAEKLEVYRQLFPKKNILPAFLSVGGFTRGAADLCKKQGIGTAHHIDFLLKI